MAPQRYDMLIKACSLSDWRLWPCSRWAPWARNSGSGDSDAAFSSCLPAHSLRPPSWSSVGRAGIRVARRAQGRRSANRHRSRGERGCACGSGFAIPSDDNRAADQRHHDRLDDPPAFAALELRGGKPLEYVVEKVRRSNRATPTSRPRRPICPRRKRWRRRWPWRRTSAGRWWPTVRWRTPTISPSKPWPRRSGSDSSTTSCPDPSERRRIAGGCTFGIARGHE